MGSFPETYIDLDFLSKRTVSEKNYHDLSLGWGYRRAHWLGVRNATRVRTCYKYIRLSFIVDFSHYRVSHRDCTMPRRDKERLIKQIIVFE